jgi:hypothetical protein
MPMEIREIVKMDDGIPTGRLLWLSGVGAEEALEVV